MFDVLSNPNAWLIAGGILVMRILNMALDTVRMLSVMRGYKTATWVLGFLQTVVFIVALGSVISDMNNILNILAYAVGFSTGNVIGMHIEQRLALGYAQLSIISKGKGTAIAEHLRELGHAVTEIPARGKDGMVTMLEANVVRKNQEELEKAIKEIDAQAFIIARDIQRIHRGYWRG